ncbi:Penicillin-binding protein 2, partial [termite gut metagenome]
MRRKDYFLRKYVIGSIAVGVVIIFLLRLWDLQFMSDEYKVNA